MYKKIDVNKWDRKAQFLFYKDFDQPFFNISTTIDVTHALTTCKDRDISFFLTCLFLSQQVIHEIDAFRYRIQGQDVVIYDKVEAGSTILFDDNTFGFCYFNGHSQLESFIIDGERQMQIAKTKKEFLPKDYRDDLIHYSILPWISFTSLQHARNTKFQDSIPKIVFGKYFKEGDAIKMPISVSVHHALVDGYHVGLYLKQLETYFRSFE